MKQTCKRRVVRLTAALAVVMAMPERVSAQSRSQAGGQAVTAVAQSSMLKINSAAELPMARAMAIGVGKALVLELPVDAKDTIISDPSTVDVSVLTPRRIVLFARAIGASNVFVLGREGNRLLTLDLTIKKDLTDLSRSLKELLPGSQIRVVTTGDGVVLSGTTATPADAARAGEIAAQVVGAAKVVNLIKTGTKEQVLLKVTIAELQRDAIRRMGINLPEAILKAGSFTFTKVMANGFPVSGGTAPGAFFKPDGGGPTIAAGNLLHTGVTGGSGSVSAMLEALERVGLSRTLAEPTLVAISGEAAKFHAGGEMPVPVKQDEKSISVTWKPFGVSLAFTPHVLSEGRISLRVAAESSELSSLGSITTDGLSIQGVSIRKAETVVEMPSGSSLAMAGLLSDQTRQNSDGVPELKNLPVLGALFRSKDFKSSQSELIILVTPYVVRPTDPGQLSRPDEGLLAPSALRGLLRGHLHRVYTQLPPDVLTGAYGYVVDHPGQGVKD